ncbi:serine hydrolase [Micromonospora echinospora]|uniref:serine hydrolase n=1 Tax=Micromonospora echinospora TaxID=1877 RepID=UPI0037B4DBE8
MRPRVTLVLAILAVLLGGGMLVPAAYVRLASDGGSSGDGAESVAAPPPTAPPPPTLTNAPVSVPFDGKYFSWALMDRQTGTITGAENLTTTNSTESMIKSWIVADYLRRLGDKPLPAEQRRQAVTAIRDSDDTAAQLLYRAGGGRAVLERLISICKLTDTRIDPKARWAYTQMSPRDAVRMGDCIADGTAAGPKWTPFLLEEMANVRGTTAPEDQGLKRGGGRWGIIDGLPPSITEQGPVGMKNGWTMLWADLQWHLNCLAVTDKWSLAVMMRYPKDHGLDYGAQVCQSVTTQLVTPQPGAALKVPQPVAKP